MDSERNLDDVKEFLIESNTYLDASEPLLAVLQVDTAGEGKDISGPVASIFRAFHSIKGVAGFLSFSNVQELTHKAEETLDRVRTGNRIFDRELGTALLEACDLLRKYFTAIATHGTDQYFESEKSNIVSRLNQFCEPAMGQAKVAALAAVTSIAGVSEDSWLFDWLLNEELMQKFTLGSKAYVDKVEQSIISILDSPTQFDIFIDASKAIERLKLNAIALGFKPAAELCAALSACLAKFRPTGSSFDPNEISIYFNACNHLKILLERTQPETLSLNQAKILIQELSALACPSTPLLELVSQQLEGQKGQAVLPTTKAPATLAPKNDIRVSLERLDKMIDLIEELGVVSTGVFSNAEISEDGSGIRKTAVKLREITEELQEITVSIRMVPLSTVFRKMIRLVGDVSTKLGKKVRLEIVGEETELDKDAVEALHDPLVHILRNCIDHGLEMPQERIAAGKPEVGVIKLQAWHSGGEALISISDDGRGISLEKVLAKAVSQGLVTSNASLSDSEILAFLFHPGFSLAKTVTEFSGRGVGMDVVKKNIDGLKGKVDLESKIGSGSSFLIRLPMANALTESMLVRVGSVKYVLRVASIRETFQPTLASVTKLPNGDELVALRGHLYPVIRLYQRHGIMDSETELDKGLIMIVENRGKQIGLFVDEVLGKIQAVIKPPPNLLKASMTLAGCSIIGTESDAVALALDINALEEIFSPVAA
jgi:two-component system, chemotaxis family, sensor kinase CheA